MIPPQAPNPTLAPNLSVINPVYKFPMGVEPMKTSEYTLITRPRNSSFELSCMVEFAVELNVTKKNPEIARHSPERINVFVSPFTIKKYQLVQELQSA